MVARSYQQSYPLVYCGRIRYDTNRQSLSVVDEMIDGYLVLDSTG